MSSNNRQVATREPGRLREVSIDKAVETISGISEKNEYRVSGKTDFDAKVYRRIAQEQGIFTKIIDFGKDNEKAWAHVRSWRGPEDKPEAIAESAVVFVYADLLLEAVMDAIDNGLLITTGWSEETRKPIREKVFPKYEIGPGGMPVITENDVALQLAKNNLKERVMGERKAITIARRNAIRELIAPEDEPAEVSETQGQHGSRDEDDMAIKLQKEIGSIFFKAADSNAEIAMEMFRDFIKTVEGVPHVSRPRELKDMGHLNKVLEAAKETMKIAQSQGGKGDREESSQVA